LFGSFLPGLGWLAPPKFTRVWEPTLLWNQLHSLTRASCPQDGSGPETGLEEINGNLLEADFWPAGSPPWPITSELPVIHPEPDATSIEAPNFHEPVFAGSQTGVKPTEAPSLRGFEVSSEPLSKTVCQRTSGLAESRRVQLHTRSFQSCKRWPVSS